MEITINKRGFKTSFSTIVSGNDTLFENESYLAVCEAGHAKALY